MCLDGRRGTQHDFFCGMELKMPDSDALAGLKQSLDVLRYEATQRGDRRSELLSLLGLTNLVLAETYAEVVHDLKALYNVLPLESSTSTEWTTPRGGRRARAGKYPKVV